MSDLVPWTDGPELPSDHAFSIWLAMLDPEEVLRNTSRLPFASPEEARAYSARSAERWLRSRDRIPPRSYPLA